MAIVTAAEEIPSLEVRRVIRAPRARVFAAWTTAAELKRWHAPGPLHVGLAELDVRVGGAYRIHMVAPDGTEHRVSGVFREVDPPRRLSYTWGWDGDHPVKDSVVTIDFLDQGTSTEVVLRHAIAHDKERTSHTGGWTAILEKLALTYDGAVTSNVPAQDGRPGAVDHRAIE